MSTPTPATTSPGTEKDPSIGLARLEMSCGTGHDRRRGHEAVDEAVDGVIGVVDPEIDADLAGLDLLQDRLKLVGQARHEVVPAANRSAQLPGEPFRIESLRHHLLDVGLQQLGDSYFGPDSSAESLEAKEDTKQQGQVGGQDEPVVVEELHAAAHDGVHVELADTDEEVTVEPGLDVGPQLPQVHTGRWRGQLQDDVDEGVDVAGCRWRSPSSRAGGGVGW